VRTAATPGPASLAWLPNAITLLRIAMALPLYWMLRDSRFDVALVIAALAGISDGLDGWLAKRFGWVTRLGAMLDPLADKLLLFACFLGLVAGGHLPLWLVLLVIGRDVVILSGALAYRVLVGPFEAAPTLISKVTTFLQIALVLWVMGSEVGLPLPASGLALLLGAVVVFTLASGAHYVLVWSGKALRAYRQPPQGASS
jgi:cardiolipin synthase (CMP-forming)